ncbi:MAG: nuclear transport factor 2 family protein [Myxococcales bacterium]|nr:nuclear transport factor 2 family protein [Myxococcales bacterium]
MSDQESQAIVETFLRELEAGHNEAALALLADDVVYENVPFPPARGKVATEKMLRQFLKLFDTFQVTMHAIAARDGVVLTERTDVLSGKVFHLDIWVCGTFEVRDGKITVWRDRFDPCRRRPAVHRADPQAARPGLIGLVAPGHSS